MFDNHMILSVVGIAIAGGLIGLDRTAVGQFMISQPIVAGPVTGWVLGDAPAGAVIGGILELIWVLDMPVGAFVPADATISVVCATVIAALGSKGDASPPVIGFSILLTAVIVPATMKADDIIRHWNSRLADSVVFGPGLDPGRALVRTHFSGIAVFFFKSFVLYLVFLPLGIVAVSAFGNLSGSIHQAMSMFVKLLPLLGVALVAHKLSMKTADIFLLGGFVSAAILGGVFHAPALLVIALVIAGGLLGASYRELRA